MTKRMEKKSAFSSSYNYEVRHVLTGNNLLRLVRQPRASTTGLSPGNFCCHKQEMGVFICSWGFLKRCKQFPVKELCLYCRLSATRLETIQLTLRLMSISTTAV